MTNQILDDGFQEVKNQRTIFAKLSFYFSIIYIITWIYMYWKYPEGAVTFNLNRSLGNPFVQYLHLFLLIQPFIGLLGFIFLVFSIVTKEPFRFYKWTSILIYQVIIVMIVSL